MVPSDKLSMECGKCGKVFQLCSRKTIYRITPNTTSCKGTDMIFWGEEFLLGVFAIHNFKSHNFKLNGNAPGNACSTVQEVTDSRLPETPLDLDCAGFPRPPLTFHPPLSSGSRCPEHTEDLCTSAGPAPPSTG